ncbi:MAG: hypothetical protein H6923_03970 [Alphaproteobacteria bacterium]|nr:hypothetical protein [Alphaproteobacteria bacterium]
MAGDRAHVEIGAAIGAGIAAATYRLPRLLVVTLVPLLLIAAIIGVPFGLGHFGEDPNLLVMAPLDIAILAAGVMWTAAYIRGCLEPGRWRPSFGFGRAELHLLGAVLLSAVVTVGFALALGLILVVSLLAAGGYVLVYAGSSPSDGAIFQPGSNSVLLAATGIALLVWLTLFLLVTARLSVVFVDVVARGRLALGEAWRLTSGEGWRLLAVTVIVGAIAAIVAAPAMVYLASVALELGAGRVMHVRGLPIQFAVRLKDLDASAWALVAGLLALVSYVSKGLTIGAYVRAYKSLR